MPNTIPFEVIAGSPIALYIAPVGTAIPALDDDEGAFDAAWKKVGLSGDLSYDDKGGVVVDHAQSTTPWRSLGDSGSRKMFRTDEDTKVKLKVIDLTLEAYSLALNGNAVRTIAAGMGTAGYKRVGFSRGLTVATHALLVRLLVSPYGAEWIGQYVLPRAAQTGTPSVAYMKGDPAGLDLEWTSLVDPTQENEDDRAGWLDWQNADATS